MVDELTGKKPEGIGSDITRAYLSNVCVAKELQRNGVASDLIKKAIAVARSWGNSVILLKNQINDGSLWTVTDCKIYLKPTGMTDLYVHVAVDNGGARKLYEKCGFAYENEEKTWQARHFGRPRRYLLWRDLTH